MLRGPVLYPTVARQWVDDVGYAGKTRDLYLVVLRCFQQRLDERHGGSDPRRFAEITAADVRDFVDVDDAGGPRADQTRSRYLGVIHGVFDWALDETIGLAERNPAARLRALSRHHRPRPSPKRRKVWLGEAGATALVSTTAGEDGPAAVRDTFLLRLALYTAARNEELRTMRWRDVNLAQGYILITGKSGKVAPVPIVPALRKALVAWRSLYVAGIGHDDLDDLPVVCATASPLRGGPAGTPTAMEKAPRVCWGKAIRSNETVRRIVMRRGQAIGVDMRPHDLRRSWAGILKDRGKSDEEIRKALRHDDTKTTRIYLEDKPEAIDGLDDLDFG